MTPFGLLVQAKRADIVAGGSPRGGSSRVARWLAGLWRVFVRAVSWVVRRRSPN